MLKSKAMSYFVAKRNLEEEQQKLNKKIKFTFQVDNIKEENDLKENENNTNTDK